MTALGDDGGARVGPGFWGPSDVGQRPRAVRSRLAGCPWSSGADGPNLVRVGVSKSEVSAGTAEGRREHPRGVGGDPGWRPGEERARGRPCPLPSGIGVPTAHSPGLGRRRNAAVPEKFRVKSIDY